MELKVKFTEEANRFLESLPTKPYQKIILNFLKLERWLVDKNLFKKLDNTKIWELRTLFCGICY